MINEISVILLAKNEEMTLPYTLAHLTEFSDVTVVDSASTDKTADIARQFGAQVVNFLWDGKYPKKKQWAIDNVMTQNDWILLLDADEYPDRNLIEELRYLGLTSKKAYGAFDIKLRYKFAGHFLKFGHVVTKRSLIHKTKTRFPDVHDSEAPGITEVEGHYQPQTVFKIGTLRGHLAHDDRDPLFSWFERHNKYSEWEVYLRSHPDIKKQVAKNRSINGRIFDVTPFKPLVFFLYSYIVKLGFLDGAAGFDYALALSFYYWQIGLKSRTSQIAN